MAHRITAGCDILLMPSRFEPCGLNQVGDRVQERRVGCLWPTPDLSMQHIHLFAYI
jgi:hypothetical protein